MSEETIFALALERLDDAARATFLAEACGGDAALRRRVEAMLLTHEKMGDFLQKPAVEQAAGPPKPSDATQAFDASTDHKGPTATPTEGAGSGHAEEADDLHFLQPSKRPDSLGRIGHYEVLQVLGKGGFGIVFRAFDDVLQRVVALKVLAPAIAATSPARKRFLREARSSAQVRHENVVQVYAVEEQPAPYLVMEFIPGETLQQRCDRTGPLEVAEIVRIGRQIAEGLAAAHATDLIHRDIKPGNILLEGGQHRVKITDFGLARAADDASLTQSGMVAGTPMYMAPEQAKGEKIDHRADLFSLGSVLYVMASGRPPFRASTTFAVLKRVVEENPRPIREVIPEMPQWLCDIIAKLHAKKPEERFQSAREVADVLADCEAQLKANAKVKDFSRIPSTKPVAGRSGGWKWVAAAALLLPVLALALMEIAGVTHWLRDQQSTETATPKVDPKADLKSSPVTGRFALAFDGQKGLVRIPSVTIITYDHALTVEIWTVLEDPVDRRKNFDLVANTLNGGFALGAPPGQHGGDGRKLAFLIRAKNPDMYVKAWEKQPVPRHQLIHLAGVYDGKAEIRFYVNGQLQSRKSVQDVRPSGVPLALGGNLGRSDEGSRFLGRINEVRISEVARYDNDFTPAKRFEPDKDTIALYHFDEGKGTVLKDSSGNGHDGEIIGAKWVKADGSPIDSKKNVSPRVPPLKHGDPEYTNTLGMKFKLIPAGKFTMGSPKEEIDRLLEHFGADAWLKERVAAEAPEHSVEITQPFYMGATEVTRGQFRQFVDDDGYQVGDGRWRNPGFDQTDQHPVVFVSWNNAVDFCKWLSKKEGKEYRLPTEAEWEYSCRAGKAGSRYGFGDDDAQLKDYAWFDQNSGGGTHPVGKKKPNAWGLYDMHGNAWEWCQDYYDPDYYKNSPVKDPLGSAGGERVSRGGAWGSAPVHCRSACRDRTALGFRNAQIGFRVLLVSPPAGVETESVAKNKPASPTIAPFTDADVQRIAALPAEQQVEEVRKELKRRNSSFDGEFEHKIEGNVVTELHIVTDKVTDIAPIRVFNSLRVLDLGGTHTNYHPNGQLADLSPLKGMNLTELTKLNLNLTKVGDVGLVHFKDCPNLTSLGLGATRVSDNGLAHFKNCKSLTSLELFYIPASDAGLAYFKDCKGLTRLNLVGTKVSDAGLANFKDCKNLTTLSLDRTQVGDAGMVHFQDCKSLTDLGLAETKVSDVGLAHFKDSKKLIYLSLTFTQVGDAGLAQLKGTPLRVLWIYNTGITDLTPLQGMPLEKIYLTPKNIARGLDILRSIKTLEKINGKPAAEFWKELDQPKAGFAPFTDADVKRIAALPAAEQVEEVRKELKRRNPGFDDKMVVAKSEGVVVTELRIVSDKVADIAPIRVFDALRVLECRGT